MGRKYVECRDFPGDLPGDTKCSATLSADTEEELLEEVIHHGITVHGYTNTPEFREKVRKAFKDVAPSK